MPLLILIPILGWIGAWVRFSKQSFAQSAIQSFSLILLILYFSALLSVLYWGMVLVISTGILLLLFSKEEYLRIIKKGENELFTLCLFILLPILFWWIHKDSKLFFWDEYSHWGMFIKHMYYTDKLYDLDSNAAHLRYLPGAALIQYLFTRNFEFSEGSVYLAQFIMIIVPLITFFDYLKNQKILNYIFLILMLVFGLNALGHGILNLYVDHLLSIWMAALLIQLLNLEKTNRILILSIRLLPCAALILIKDAGAFFVLGILGIYYLIEIAEQISWKYFFKKIQLLLPTIILLITVIISWNLNREYRAIPSSVYSGPGMFKAIFLGDTPLADEQYQQQVEKYWEILSELPIKKTEEHRNYNEFNYNLIEKFKKIEGLSTVGWLLVFIFISTLSIKFSENKYKEIIFYILVFCWVFSYFMVLLGSYLYANSSEYWLRFPSSVRFIQSGLLVLFIVVFVQITINFSKVAEYSLLNLYVSSLLLSWLFFSETPYLSKSFQLQPMSSLRQQIEAASIDKQNKLEKNDSIWIYSPIQDNGFISVLFKYQFEPNKVVYQNQEIPDEKFIEQWKSVDYLWFPINQSMQKGVLKKLYEDTNATFFKVKYESEKLEIIGIR